MQKTPGQQTHLSTRSKGWSWPFWPVVPIYPYGKRQTLRREVVKDTIWTFDQIQGILYVVVPIRMTVVKLEAGGLLVYAPVASTAECIQLVNELVAEHGDVKYIILPTVSGIEHKVFVGPFAQHFPAAQVFVVPGQWSFPLNLPLSWLGFPRERTQVLPQDSTQSPFADEFDYAILGPLKLGLGLFGEVAFFHRRSRTLLITDLVLSVPETPPAIVQLDLYPLLFHGKDDAFSVVEDSEVSRRRGWQRISLFAAYIRPSAIEVIGWGQAFRNALNAPNQSKKAYFGLFPFKWKDDWKQSFDVLRGSGRLFVAPILQTLILNRAPEQTIDWADRVASWNFQRVISCHFDSPVEASPRQFRQAFSFLEKQPILNTVQSTSPLLPKKNFGLIEELEKILIKIKVVPPPREKV